MLGQTHKAFATTFAISSLILLHYEQHYLPNESVQKIITNPIFPILIIPITIFAYISSTWPDIDSHHKIIGQFFKHRGITHSIFVILLWLVLIWKCSFNIYLLTIIYGLAIGWISHVIGDAYSIAGVELFYPIRKYGKTKNGHQIVKHKRYLFIPLYSTGKSKLPWKYFWYIVSLILLIFYFTL